MTTARSHTLNGLHWLQEPLEGSLARVRSTIEQHLESGDHQPLLDAIEELRQVRGTLAMIQCAGGELLAREILALLQALAQVQVASSEEAFAALSGATLQLSDYLELLYLGHNDYALVLQPLINELRLARGQPLRTEAELFAAQMQALEVELPLPPPTAEAPTKALAQNELGPFQSAFLSWFRNEDVAGGLAGMRRVAGILVAVGSSPDERRFWWLLGLLCESLQEQPESFRDSLDLKRLFGRAGTALKRLAGGAPPRSGVDPDTWQTLYWLLRLPRRTDSAQSVLRAANLLDLLPDDAELERMRRRMRGPGVGILHRLHEEIHADFQTIKDAIDLIVRTRGRAGGDPAALRGRLQQLAAMLQLLGLPGPAQALSNQAGVLDQPEIDPDRWMELGTALLRVEHSLEEALFRAQGRYSDRASRSYEEIASEIPPLGDYKESVGAVLREALVDVAALKSSVEVYLKDGEKEGLYQAPRLTDEIAAALEILDRRKPAALVRELQQCLRPARLQALLAQRSDVDWLADTIAALELYLEALRDELPQPQALIDALTSCLERMPEPDQAVAAGEPPVSAAAPDAGPRTSDSEVAETAAIASRKPGATAGTALIPDEVDPEIRSIFVEEAGELLDELRQLLPPLRRNAEDSERLTAVRRAFHTLKGSGRMVGATRLAEMAWAIEQVLNRCLDGTIAVRTPVLELVDAAFQMLPDLLGELQRATEGKPAGFDQLIERADALAQGDSVGTDMVGVFRGDAHERLGLVARWLQSLSSDMPAEVEPEVIRAFHTLRGSAAAVQAQGVAQLAGWVEKHLGDLQSNGHDLQPDTLVVIAEAVRALGDWVARTGDYEPPPAELEAWQRRLGDLRSVLPAAERAAEARQATALVLLDTLQAADAAAREWEQAPESRPPALTEALTRLSSDAILSVPSLSEASAALAQRVEEVDRATPALFPALADVFESCYQLLDEFREGRSSADVAALLDRIAGLPVVAPAPASGTVAQRPTASLEREPAEGATETSDVELRDIFFIEARDLFAGLERAMADLAAEPDSVEAAAELRRGFHTLYGSARLAGYDGLGIAAQRLEQALDGVLESSVAIEPALLMQLWEGLRGLQRQYQQVREEAAPSDSTERTWAAEIDETVAPPDHPSEPEPVAASGSEAARDEGKPPAEELEPVTDLERSPAAEVPLPPPVVETPELEVPGEVDTELVTVFAAEAAELIEQLETALDGWQAGDESESVRTVQRALHTLKGSARVAGLQAIGDWTHQLETRIETLLAGGELPDTAAFAELREGVERLAGTLDATLRAVTAPAAARPSEPVGMWEDAAATASRAPAAPKETARVPVAALDAMLADTGEISIFRARLEEHAAGLRSQLGELAQTIARVRQQLRLLEIETEAQIAARGRLSGGPDRYAADFDPLELDRYTRMQELSRALSETGNDLVSLQVTMEAELAASETLLGQHARVAAQVQQGLMGALMVPFSRQMARLARLVRSSAAEAGKRAELVVEGANTQLDRNVLERVMPPLEHLLRNAVVHGVETPDARRAAGKRDIGQLQLHVSRDGGQLSIELADDGTGLDFDAIRARAIDRGLLRADAKASRDDLARFIFEPGFSTARTLTQSAGRGVGLDVVASVIKQLNGTLELRSEPGVGTRFSVRLPLSLALSQALLVEIGGEFYAIPLSLVEGVERLPASELEQRLAPDAEPLRYGDHDYPLHYLGDFLGVAPPTEFEARTVTAVLMRAGKTLTGDARRTALLIDRLIGNREIVSKPAGPQLSAVAGIAGGTILADGRVVLILDVPALLAEAARRRLSGESGTETAAPTPDTIMVVDDSITMRRVAERLLVRHGFRVVTARDGLEAIALLSSEAPTVMLLDIEMPRADGFEVVEFMRNNERLSKTPIIMITSRSGDKHRERAQRLGVQRYLIKPYQEEQLLAEIETLREQVPQERAHG